MDAKLAKQSLPTLAWSVMSTILSKMASVFLQPVAVALLGLPIVNRESYPPFKLISLKLVLIKGAQNVSETILGSVQSAMLAIILKIINVSPVTKANHHSKIRQVLIHVLVIFYFSS